MSRPKVFQMGCRTKSVGVCSCKGVKHLRFSIGVKLGIGFALVIMLLGAVTLSGINGRTGIVNLYEEEVLRLAEANRLAEQLQHRTLMMAYEVVVYFLNAPEPGAGVGAVNRSAPESFVRAQANFAETLALLERETMSAEGQSLLAHIRDLEQEYGRNANMQFGMTTAERAQIRDESIAIRVQLQNAVADILQLKGEFLEVARKDAHAVDARAQLTAWLLSVSAIIIGVVVAFVINRGIVGPIRQVERAARRLADGDLTLEDLNIASNDEIGDMGAAFNRMVVNLRGVMERIRQTSAALLDNGKQLLTVADESTQATGQIAAAVNQVAQGSNNQVQQVQQTGGLMEHLRQAIDQIASGAQQQAQHAEQTSRSLEEMVQSVDGVARSAQQVAAASGRGTDRARAGGEAVQNVVEGMGELRAAVGQVAERIDELGGYSREIGQIVDMISDIAEQTNLLALNAAIEAARAGEHGRGFGVVAEEVRQLAERSAESTREIGQLVQNIQVAVEVAVEAMDSGTGYVESGTELAGNARRALEEIIEAIASTDEYARSISDAAQQMADAGPVMLQAMGEMASVTEENTAATEQMAASSDQVVQAVNEVIAISEETAAATEEVSASTEEVDAAAEDMKASVQTLTNIAGELEELVGRFRV